MEDSLIDDYFLLELNYCKSYQDAYELFVSNGLEELYSPNQIVEIWNKALSSRDTIESKFYTKGW